MWADLATMVALVQGEYFLTNVLPYWAAFAAAMVAIVARGGREW